MQTFAISFLVFAAFGLALALGLLLGRGPLRGGCRPGAEDGGCARRGNCALPCARRRGATKKRETRQC